MSYNEVSWDFPQYSAYSILNVAVNPAVCWNALQNNPFIEGFEVWYLDTLDNLWVSLGITTVNYARFPADEYSDTSVYQIRVATIGINGTASPFSYSTVTLASPLVFNFTSAQNVKLAVGTTVPNQRFIFLIL